MKISIVTAYYNRKSQLLTTLRSIGLSKHKNDVEIIIVDDGSNDEHRIHNVPSLFDMDIKIIRVDKSEKWWINPCIPYNMGLSKANGDVIILQNPECFHTSDILDYINSNIIENDYLVFGCNSLVKDIYYTVDRDYSSYGNIMFNLVHDACFNGSSWYQHSIYRSTKFNFCSAIHKKDIMEMGGFDERYANGIAYDDTEFLFRINQKKLTIKEIDDPFVLHQQHSSVFAYNINNEPTKRNLDLYENVTKNSSTFACKENKILTPII